MFTLIAAEAARTVVTQAGAPQGGGFSMIIMLVVMFAIIYMLMIRPQQKQQKRHREFLAQMKKNDEVVTNSGILGKVFAVEETVVTLEIADKVRIKVLKQAVSSPRPGSESEVSSDESNK